MAVLMTSLTATALPARPDAFSMRQPDGSSVTVRLVGDEFFHYYMTADGFPIVKGADGAWYFAEPDGEGRLTASEHRAADAEGRDGATRSFLSTVAVDDMLQGLAMAAVDSRREARRQRGPGLFANATFPTLGKQKALVILVEYQDVKFRLNDPYDYFSRMLNEEGFSDRGGTGSARDYYVKGSEGRFEPEFDVYGPVTLPHNMAYYGANTMSGRDGISASYMVVDACQMLDSQIDFTQYDRDGDGVIDNVFLFYAGLGEATGGGDDSVWPHSAEAPYGNSFDGKVLRTYGCTNEWVPRGGGAGRPDGIGAFCHEFAHVLGLPDLYATTTVHPTPFTPGYYSLLDVGPYNNDGCTPPAVDLFSRYALGWWEPTVIEGPMNCKVSPLSESGTGYMIATSDPNEYFLIENRQKTGWDKYIPGHGLLVWHVDYDPSAWAMHAVNNDAAHQHVDILEADGILTEATRAGDTFPGTEGVRELTGESNPAMTTWSGGSVYALTDITELPDGNVTLKVGGGAEPAAALTALEAAEVTPRSLKARWATTADAVAYRLRVVTRKDGATVAVPGYDGRITTAAGEAEVIGLEPETTYYYTVTYETEKSESSPSNEVAVTTPPLTHEYVIPKAMEATEVSENGFTARWMAEDGADDYSVDVERRTLRGTEEATEAFDNRTSTWQTNSTTFYASASYVGRTAPSLRLTDGNYVMAPPTERGAMRTLSFWHRAHGGDENTRLIVETYANGCWGMIASYVPETAKGGKTITINDLGADAVAVRVMVSDASGTAQVYADDFTLTYGGSESIEAVTGWSGHHTGNVTQAAVAGLEPGTEYRYRVRAIAGGIESMPSEAVTVKTAGVSGIENVTTSDATIRTDGRSIIVEAAAGCEVSVYDLAGHLVAVGKAPARIAVPAPGFYIVRAGEAVEKVSL